MLPVSVVEFAVGGTGAVGAEAEQSSEGHGSIEASVKPEHEFVEVRLEMGLGHTVEDAVEPGFEVGGDGADHRQPGVHAALDVKHRERSVVIALGPQVLELTSVVGEDAGTGSDAVFGETIDGGGRFVGELPHPDSTRQGALFDPAGLRVADFPLTNFDSDDDRHLSRLTWTASLVLASDESDVHLDGPLSADGVSVRTDHGRSELVQELKRRLVARDPELALQLQRRDPSRRRCHQVGRTKPDLERRSSSVHDRPGRDGGGLATRPALEDGGSRRQPEWFSDGAAVFTSESRRPAKLLQVLPAGRFVGKHSMELQQVRRKVR